MADDSSGQEAPTRRDYMKYGGAVVGGSLLAGCAGQSDSGSTPTATGTDEESTATSTSDDESYSVTMSPVGTVEFDEVPSNVMVYSPQYADMLVAVGHDDALNSLGFPEAYGKTLNYYLSAVEGVSLDYDGLTKLLSEGSFDQELLFELDSDIHLMDPSWAANFDGWDRSDAERIRDEVGPWFGNRHSRAHSEPPEDWRDGYQYYSIWGLTDKVAQVFQERERFRALEQVHTELRAHIRENLPPEGERPTVGVITFYDEAFHPYKLNGPGFGRSDTRSMGATDAFADIETVNQNWDVSYDYEQMLEIDPDVLLHRFAVTPFYDWPTVRETISSNSLGKELTAVQTDQFYASGWSFQGPLTNLFQLEMNAKQLYPETFGEFPDVDVAENYPDVPEEEQLFDRQRVADIINGDI